MSSDNVAIRVQRLNKIYQIYNSPKSRLKQFIAPKLQKLTNQPVKQYFQEFVALKNISIEVKKGQTVGIIGRNGSGKSTLLQVICGTLTPSSGNVEIQGRVAALLELGSGFNPDFTGRENIYMNATVLGLRKEEIDSRYNEIITYAGIGKFIEQPVKTYSSGMVVRLAFAIIMHVDAEILVIDEALSVGDVFFVQKCMRSLRKFMETGTIFFVSHDMGSILNLCDTAYLLREGVIEASGDPKSVAKHYIEDIYSSQQNEEIEFKTTKSTSNFKLERKPLKDMRQDFINSSKHRNDIEIIQFPKNTNNFGIGGATIAQVQLLDSDTKPLSWVVGGEQVSLSIVCKTNINITSPIIGFTLKDRLGQALIGDNTYLTYIDQSIKSKKGEFLKATFTFFMPILPLGEYSFDIAIAEGTQSEHTQHDWTHDALTIKSVSSSIVNGLVGIPMQDIRIEVLK